MKRRNNDAEGCEQMQVDEGGRIDLAFLYIRKCWWSGDGGTTGGEVYFYFLKGRACI